MVNNFLEQSERAARAMDLMIAATKGWYDRLQAEFPSVEVVRMSGTIEVNIPDALAEEVVVWIKNNPMPGSR